MRYQEFPKPGSQVLLQSCEGPGRVSHYFICLNHRKLWVTLLCGSTDEQSYTMHHDLTLTLIKILHETKSQKVSPVNTKWFYDRQPG